MGRLICHQGEGGGRNFSGIKFQRHEVSDWWLWGWRWKRHERDVVRTFDDVEGQIVCHAVHNVKVHAA